MFHPAPIILQSLLVKNRKCNGDKSESGLISPGILSAWFHDLLSAIAHCHSYHVILRTLHPDQIVIDHSGVAKLSGLSHSSILHPEDRFRFLDPIKSIKAKKKSRGTTDNDILTNPYVAPEIMLGGTQYTQQSDIWNLGCLIAHVILSKQLFSGRDRVSKMRSIFKIVGIPSSINYINAKDYPYYNKCKLPSNGNSDKQIKKYRKCVKKAMSHMLKESNVNPYDYSGALDLLECMLDLDPSKRISAIDALEHDYMNEYVVNIKSDKFRQKFADDWISLKRKTVNSCNIEYLELSKLQTKKLKRKASHLSALGRNGQDIIDDLYNFDEDTPI